MYHVTMFVVLSMFNFVLHLPNSMFEGFSSEMNEEMIVWNPPEEIKCVLIKIHFYPRTNTFQTVLHIILVKRDLPWLYMWDCKISQKCTLSSVVDKYSIGFIFLL